MNEKEEKFLAIIRQNQGIIRKITSVYASNDHYDDLFQEILLNLWRSYDQFEGRSKISTWMYKVALYTGINFRNYEARRSFYTLEENTRVIEGNVDRRDALSEAMKYLKSEEKALLVLYLEEKSYEEMAEIMGITLSNVGVRLTRIRKKLKKILDRI